MSKWVLQGHIVVPKEDLAAVVAGLPSHIALTLNEPGCLVFEVRQNATDPCRFDVYEEFESKAAFDSHQARVAVSDWGELTVNVTRHYTTTEVAN